jgi:hypothetical protein
VNPRLAAHYGLPHVNGSNGSEFQRVDLGAAERQGILTHGSVLAITSNADGTSVVKRGKWVLDSLLCIYLELPAQDVPGLPPPETSGDKFQQLEQHRTNPECAGCHNILDPPGFALEAYDPIGRLRTVDELGHPLHTSGKLPNGSAFKGARELAALLAKLPDFQRCMTRNLFAFGLGRELTEGDLCVSRQVAEGLDFASKTFADLTAHMVTSSSFLSEGAAP